MIWWLLLACRPAGVANDCTEDRPCDWGQVCVEGTCVQGSCATSAQCPIEHFCFADVCYPGCRADTDCSHGFHCDTELGTCEADRCEDTQIDCAFGEYCDTTTGTCFDAGEQFCRPCQRSVQCGENNRCWNNHCGVDCNDRECPAGFDCSPFRDAFGNIETYQCVAYCELNL